MATVTQLMTAEQLFQANLRQCELVEGEIISMSPASFNHGRFAGNIFGALRDFVVSRHLGVVVTAEAGFHIGHDPDTVRVPDVAFVRAERIPPDGADGFFQGPPDVAVEVVSPSDRASEVRAKAQAWLQAGCQLVWVVDPKPRTVSVYHTGGEVTVLTEADALTGGEVLPGFSAPVKDVFA
jgi:Uma2 family endonuclease